MFPIETCWQNLLNSISHDAWKSFGNCVYVFISGVFWEKFLPILLLFWAATSTYWHYFGVFVTWPTGGPTHYSNPLDEHSSFSWKQNLSQIMVNSLMFRLAIAFLIGQFCIFATTEITIKKQQLWQFVVISLSDIYGNFCSEPTTVVFGWQPFWLPTLIFQVEIWFLKQRSWNTHMI